MKNLFVHHLPLLVFFDTCCRQRRTGHDRQAENNDQVIHRQEVYKTVDTLKLKIDIFYTNKSFEKENNTAIVFFMAAVGPLVHHVNLTTCERYAKMGIVTFSVEYRLSIDNGVTPSKDDQPIECVMDAKSAIRWVRGNAKNSILTKIK